jgi:hypothetical protein
VGQVVDLPFQGLVVLALELEFGLQLFHQQFEARYFRPEFLGIVAGNRPSLRRRWRLRGLVVLSGMAGVNG